MTLDDGLRVTTERALAEQLSTTGSDDLRRSRSARACGSTTATSSPPPTSCTPSGASSIPASRSPHRGAFRGLQSVDARDRYTVVFTLTEPFSSFPINLVIPQIVPDGAGPDLANHPIGTGPYRFVRHTPDDLIELDPFRRLLGGRPRTTASSCSIVPDEVMRGLELRKGTIDLVINDVSPDILHQLRGEDQLQTTTAPGVDYQYIGST